MRDIVTLLARARSSEEREGLLRANYADQEKMHPTTTDKMSFHLNSITSQMMTLVGLVLVRPSPDLTLGDIARIDNFTCLDISISALEALVEAHASINKVCGQAWPTLRNGWAQTKDSKNQHRPAKPLLFIMAALAYLIECKTCALNVDLELIPLQHLVWLRSCPRPVFVDDMSTDDSLANATANLQAEIDTLGDRSRKTESDE
jgi:hypothetical protein